MTEAGSEHEVVYLWPYLEWGGAQIYYFGLMKLVGEHYPVTAIMPRGSAERLLQYLARLRVPIEFLPARMGRAAGSFGDRLRRRWENITAEWVIARQLGKRNLRRTVLHLEIAPWASFWLLAYLSLRSNVFVTLHTALPAVGLLRYWSWSLKFRLLARLRGFHLLTSNRDTRESLRPFLSDSKRARIPIAYSGVDVDEINQALALPFDRGELCRQFGLPENGLLVFCLGQFIERKGCHTLLEAARELRQESGEVFFVWVGTSGLTADQKKQIEASGAADRFRYISAKELGGDRLALLKLIRLADIFALPSLQEGLPIALLEAMALGKACVASDINAIPEAIQDIQNGLLVPPADGGALAEALSMLINDEPLRQRLGVAARETVLNQFNERLSAETTLAYYETCWTE
jgi:glycosyltransferase involved in cell wall biosynthesis